MTFALLLMAALLFSGFLQVQLTGQELLTQRAEQVTVLNDLLARVLADAGDLDGAQPDSKTQIDAFRDLITAFPFASSLGLVNHRLTPQPLPVDFGGYTLDMADLSFVRNQQTTRTHVLSPTLWNLFSADEPGVIRVTSPLLVDGAFAGALQGEYPLTNVQRRVDAARNLVVLYTLLYGAVLLLFGVYLLNRVLFKPLKRLHQATTRVADGDFSTPLTADGPRELAEVATAFNRMVEALALSRQKTDESLTSLQKANRELRETRKGLIRSEKLASVGQLAAGMAHEIGNPLGATIGYLEMLRSELPAGEQRDLVGHAQRETGRIDRLVRELLDYAAPAPDEAEMLDLAEVARETCELLQHQGMLGDVTCRCDVSEPLVYERLSRQRIQQVLINLILNARDASPAGGEICLSGGTDPEAVWLAVSDQGEGIAPQLQGQLFDPFFTTKPPGSGRGLGLFISHRIMTDAGGQIELQSEPGVGSRFVVRWPVRERT